MDDPAVEKIAEDSREDPFRVLISTMLSAQTRDAVTHAASMRLFRVARTPRTLAALPRARVQRLIYPVSFYRVKSRHVREASRQIVERFGGRVPDRMEDLLTLPGVGRKTANLVLILSHASRENICVDTHVHRIANRLGWVTDAHAGADRAGALSRRAEAVLAEGEPVSGHVGTECVPAGVSAMPRVRRFGAVPEGGRYACGDVSPPPSHRQSSPTGTAR